MKDNKNANENGKTSVFSKAPVMIAVALLCCALWGSAYSVIKIGARLFGVESTHAPSMILFAGIRFFIAGFLTILIGSALGRKWLTVDRKSFPMAVKLSLAQTIGQYTCFYIGLGMTSAVRSSILSGASCFVTIFMACLVFRSEKLTVRKAAGSLLAFAGVVVINLSSSAAGGSLKGDAILLTSCIAYSFSISMMKKYSAYENPVTLSGYQFMIGGIVMVVIGLLLGGKITAFSLSAAGVMLYLGLLSAVAYSMWGVLLKHNPVSRIAVFYAVTPLFGVLISAIMPEERGSILTLANLAALVLVCIGTAIVNTGSAVKPKE